MTGLRKEDTQNTLTKKHRFDHNDFENCLTRGIVAATLTNTEETTQPTCTKKKCLKINS